MKNAEMGVGTLIVFIAMLLVAAVAAGVLIQTAGSLQEKSLSTGQQSRAQISTNAETIEVSASDGRDGDLLDFQQIMKLAPGSDPIKLDQIIFTFNTKDNTATLQYRGINSVCEENNQNGYNTWSMENITVAVDLVPNDYTLNNDYDDDGVDDYMYLYNNTAGVDYLYFNLSTHGVLNVSLGQDIGLTAQPIDLQNVAVSNGTDTILYVTLTAPAGPQIINASTNFTVTPFELGEGYFAVVYEQTGTNHVDGNMQRGDVIRLCYEGPRDIIEDEEVRLNFIPKIGTATLTQFVTPDVMSTERVYLYP